MTFQFTVENHKSRYTVVHHDFISLLDGHVEVDFEEHRSTADACRLSCAQCEAFLRFQGASEADFLAALASVQAQWKQQQTPTYGRREICQETGHAEWRPFKSLLDKTVVARDWILDVD